MMNLTAKKIFDSLEADAVLTTQEDLRFYLTGFESSFGVVIIDNDCAKYYTDSRYLEAAKKNVREGFEVLEYPKGVALRELLKSYKKLAIPVDKTFASEYIALANAGFEITDSSPSFRSEMAIKSQSELENIRLACQATDRAFNDLLPQIKEGMTENEVAATLEYLMRKHGASGTSFSTICGFGANGSVPHHETGSTKLRFGDIILIDFGCKIGGYCSDCTRTFLFGDDGKHEDFKTAYGHVLKAHNLVKERATSGMTGKQFDAFARDYLKEQGLDKYFTHSLGHGIGVNIHEYPNLSPSSDHIMCDGMVFSDEPGVYFEGSYGIRIEDTVTLADGKVVSLTNSEKNLIIL
ncbi:MAG: M24 family metallopeptidase [Candidatus Coproplasma sp.]